MSTSEGLLGRSLRTLRPGRGRAPVRTSAGGRATGEVRHGRPRLLWPVGALMAVVVLFGAWAWLRTSSLVAVQRVQVTGVSGPDAAQVTAALTAAARGMTSLDVHAGTLSNAVSPYPSVKALTVSGEFPHGLRIRVTEQVPLAELVFGGQRAAVAADGTLLPATPAGSALPQMTVTAFPGGRRIEAAGALAQLRVLAAAPYAVLARVAGVSSSYWHGVVVSLRQGVSLYFGDSSRLADKWRAALSVLGNAQAQGASYIDVSDPQRPAAGTTAAAAAAYDASSAATTAAATGATSSAATTGATSSTTDATPSTSDAAPSSPATPSTAAATPAAPASTSAATPPGGGG